MRITIFAGIARLLLNQLCGFYETGSHRFFLFFKLFDLSIEKSGIFVYNRSVVYFHGEDVFKMSASRERKKRMEERAREALSPKKKKNKKESSRRRLTGIIAGLVLLTLLYLFLAGTGLFQANLTALTIGDVKITGLEFNYHYYRAITDMENLYRMYGMDVPFDRGRSLKRQEQSEDQSWADYFTEQVVESLTTIVIQSEQARAANISLSREDRWSIDREIENINEAAEERRMRPQRFLQSQFGQGLTINKFQEFLERVRLSERYKAVTMEGFGDARTDEEVTAHYDENRENYDYVVYHSFEFDRAPEPEEGEDGMPVEISDEELEAFEKEQRERAEEMLERVTTSEEFLALSREFEDDTEADTDDDTDTEGDTDAGTEADTDTDDDTDTNTEDDTGTDTEADTDTDTDEDTDDEDEYDENPDGDDPTWNDTLIAHLEEALGEFLGDTARKEGDKELLEDDTSFHVVLFVDRYRQEEQNVDVRHILVSFPEGPEYEDDTDTDEDTDADDGMGEDQVPARAKEAAQEQAEAILEDWKNGAQTADSFAVLAHEKSDDPGSRDNGGLYEDISRETGFVPEFLDWCFYEDRKDGDTGLVTTSHGIHIMFLDRILYPQWKESVISDMNDEAFEQHFEELSEDIEAKTNALGMFFARAPLDPNR